MFNLRTAKIQVQEKNLRDNNVGPEADDTQPITEKAFDDHKDAPIKTTEAEFDHEGVDDQIIEKVLNSSKKWRTAEDGLLIPPINTMVAQLEADRRKKLKTEKSSNWTQQEKDQNQGLPDWPKNAPQHDKMVLNNDPRRVNQDSPQELLGGKLTTAHIDNAVRAIKAGATLEYDAAIVAILKEADAEKRELTPVEQKAVSDLKISRTKAALTFIND